MQLQAVAYINEHSTDWTIREAQHGLICSDICVKRLNQVRKHPVLVDHYRLE
jgi:hypothetical protein